MTDKELNELTERHFAAAENKTLYHVCRDCDEPCVYTEEEWGNMKDFLESHNCCNCVEEVMSPLPKADFKRLVLYKANDPMFWICSAIQEGVVIDYGFSAGL